VKTAEFEALHLVIFYKTFLL